VIRPWYAEHFANISRVSFYWRGHYDELRQKTAHFSNCFYDSTLPPEVLVTRVRSLRLNTVKSFKDTADLA